MGQKRIAVIPLIRGKKQNKVCLVTSRCSQKWIIPTGKHEKHLSDIQVAELEAYEEAGLIGKLKRVKTKPVKMTNPCGDKKRKVKLYLIEVNQTLENWPEAHQRFRKMVPVNKLGQFLSDKKLTKLIQKQF